MKSKTLLAVAIALAGAAGGANAQTFVSTDVTTNTTWCGGANPGPIILQNAIFVKNGAILTILPGCDVRGQPRTAAVLAGSTVGVPGSVIVTQNGRIVAEGSSGNPIVFTTAAVDNDNNGIGDDLDNSGFKDEFPGFLPGGGCPGACTPASVAQASFLDDTPRTAPLAPLAKDGNTSNVQLWGGLVILGHAPTNLADECGTPPGYGKCTVEGLTVPGFPIADATYGGVLPHDNSGSLRFVSIRHAGDEVGNSNELNGLSMGGVGSGTTIENVEVYANFDDGFEWFGGTNNGKNLHVAFVGDDMFDADEGYTGINQFLFGIMPFFNENDAGSYGSASGDKGTEFDGENFRPDNVLLNDNLNRRRGYNAVDDLTPWPLSHPAFYNMTIIGTALTAGPDFTPVSAASTNRGIQFRNGFAGDVFNTIVVNTGGETGIEVDTNAATSPAGFSTVDNANNDLIALVCSTLDDGAALAAQETTVVTNGNDLSASLGGGAGSNNVVNDVPSVFSGLQKEDASFNPTGDANGKLVSSLKASPINPRPNLTGGIVGCVAPQNPGVDRGATFRGAFARTAATLWTTGWTTLNIAGLLIN